MSESPFVDLLLFFFPIAIVISRNGDFQTIYFREDTELLCKYFNRLLHILALVILSALVIFPAVILSALVILSASVILSVFNPDVFDRAYDEEQS